MSGHLDSWDVGQGAMDDGGGAMISWEALSLIKDLGNMDTHIPYRHTHINNYTVEIAKVYRRQQLYTSSKTNSQVNDLLYYSLALCNMFALGVPG